jgi:hypothetical protein
MAVIKFATDKPKSEWPEMARFVGPRAMRAIVDTFDRLGAYQISELSNCNEMAKWVFVSERLTADEISGVIASGALLKTPNFGKSSLEKIRDWYGL